MERGGKTILGNSKPRFLLTEGFAKSGRKCDCLGRWLTLKKGTARMDRGMDGWMEEGENGGGVGRNAKGEARKSTSPAKFGGGRGTSGLVIVASSNRKRRIEEEEETGKQG